MKRLLAVWAMALLAATVDAEQFQFVDEWTAENIPAYGLTHAALSVVKPDNLTRGPHSLLGAVRYATLTFRDSEGVELPVVVVLVEWPSGRSALYIDADADGKLSNRERAEAIDPSMSPPGFAGGQDRVWLTRLTRPFARTAAFRLTEDGTQLTCALKGYAQASLPLGIRNVQAIAVDINADMVWSYGTDVVYVDQNDDGLFGSPERFTFERFVEVGDWAFALTCGPVETVAWEPTEIPDVTVTFTIASANTPPDQFVAVLKRAGGKITQITALDEPVTLKAGTYKVESVTAELHYRTGTVWTYAFKAGKDTRLMKIMQSSCTPIELLGSLSAKLNHISGVDRGEQLSTYATVESETGLRLAYLAQGKPGGQSLLEKLLGLGKHKEKQRGRIKPIEVVVTARDSMGRLAWRTTARQGEPVQVPKTGFRGLYDCTRHATFRLGPLLRRIAAQDRFMAVFWPEKRDDQ